MFTNFHEISFANPEMMEMYYCNIPHVALEAVGQKPQTVTNER